MVITIEEQNRLSEEISIITTKGSLIKSEVFYSGAHNYYMNTSAIYELEGKYYSIEETYNPDTNEYEESYCDITDYYSKVVEEKERLSKDISNITNNGKLIESEIYYNGAHNSNMNTSAVYELEGKYYSVEETYNPDTYEYEESYSILTDYHETEYEA